MYVVTGGAGFIGSNMVAAIEEAGLGRVVVCDRLRDGVKWKNIAKRDLFDIVHPDRLLDFLDTHAAAVKAIVHMGAISATTETDADKIVDNNFRLSVALWRWCTAHQVPLIYASSAATYGDGKQGFSDDSSEAHLATLRPLNAYGWSKHLFDRWVVHNLKDGEPSPPQWAGLKFFNVYGPNEAHKGSMKSVIAQIYPTVKAGGTCRLFQSHRPDYEDGGQLRDFVWIGDCIDVMMWLLDNPEASGLFNCGTGQARAFKDLAAATYRALGMDPKIEYVPTPEQIRDKYQYFTQADMSRLRDAGYDKPFTPLEEGVARYVNDYLDAEDPFR
jgi:ADP-L-glycero-D-manno-heptose 6-epimerase